MQRVIHFSGGRTSAYMTIREYKQGDIVLFGDTGREHAKTYKFIHDFEAYENIPVKWLQKEGGFDAETLKRKTVPNNYWRYCTTELKVLTARRYLRSLGLKNYVQLIGFRADEPQRVHRYKEQWKTVTTNFPLYQHGIDKQMVVDYWLNKEYDLETPSILGNCDLCFLKGKANIISIMAQYPELADKWIRDEDRAQATFINGITYRQMLEISQRPRFKQTDLFELQPAFNCACTA